MIVVGVYRFILGGSGVWMGVAVVFFSGIIGLLWRHFRPFWRNKNSIWELLGMSLLVHIVMLCCTLFLPKELQWATFQSIFFPVIFIYPLSAVLLGCLMIRQYENWENKRALNISEERWHFALEGADDGVWDWNLKTNEVYFSKQWKYQVGYNEDDEINTFNDWKNLIFHDDKEKVMLLANQTIHGEKPIFEAEYRFLCKDGTYKWILSRGKIMNRDENGNPIRFIGTQKDISERKEKELQLEHERYLVEALMNYSPESIYFKDLKSRFIRINNSSARSFGFTDASQAKGMSDFDFFSKEYATKTFNDEQEIIRTGLPIIEEEKGNWKDGAETWGLSNKMPLRNPEGEIVGTFGITINITERKLAEQALKESEQYTSSILSAIPDLIFILNSEGVFLEFKTGNLDDLAMSKEMFLNRNASEIFPESIALQIKSGIDSVLDRKKINSFEYELPINGVNCNFESYIIPFGDNKVIAMVRNITKRKQVEEALRTSQSQLKKYASHLQDVREEERVLLAREIHDELGQILIALKIDLGLLKHYVIKNTENPRNEDIGIQFENVLGLLDSAIKTTRKIMTGLRPEVLELVGFSEAARLHVSDFEERHHVKCQFENEISKIKISSEQSIALFRILQEALTNIAKHARATEVKINLSLQNDKIRMEIADNGIGLDRNMKAKQDSYGLIGMRERVFLLDGHLSVSGESGKGTTVMVEIPYSV